MSDDADAKARTDREAVDRDYPYDPSAVMHELRMPEKLRAERDRELAAVIYAGWRRNEERLAPVEMFKPSAPSQSAAQSRELLDWNKRGDDRC